jgi:hypothetical protein
MHFRFIASVEAQDLFGLPASIKKVAASCGLQQ